MTQMIEVHPAIQFTLAACLCGADSTVMVQDYAMRVTETCLPCGEAKLAELKSEDAADAKKMAARRERSARRAMNHISGNVKLNARY